MFTVDLRDVQQLLRSRELAEVQSEIAEALGTRIVPERFATPYQRALAYAEIPVQVVYTELRQRRSHLTRFVQLHLGQPEDSESIDGECRSGLPQRSGPRAGKQDLNAETEQ